MAWLVLNASSMAAAGSGWRQRQRECRRKPGPPRARSCRPLALTGTGGPARLKARAPGLSCLGRPRRTPLPSRSRSRQSTGAGCTRTASARPAACSRPGGRCSAGRSAQWI
eukprot:9467751-Pyramimonas_sp.AAC.1